VRVSRTRGLAPFDGRMEAEETIDKQRRSSLTSFKAVVEKLAMSVTARRGAGRQDRQGKDG
jgi:hypothetical protein